MTASATATRCWRSFHRRPAPEAGFIGDGGLFVNLCRSPLVVLFGLLTVCTALQAQTPELERALSSSSASAIFRPGVSLINGERSSLQLLTV